MKTDANPTDQFNGWFVKPIEQLKKLPEGDGAFAALMIAFPLYERYIRAKLKLAGEPSKLENIQKAIATDLGLTDGQRRVFWQMFRVGFTHQGMVNHGKTQWLVSHRFGALPKFQTLNGKDVICFDPWKFTDRVLNLFLDDTRLITASDSFPLAKTFAIDPSKLGPPKTTA